MTDTVKALCEVMAKFPDEVFNSLEWEEIEGVNSTKVINDQLRGATILRVESTDEYPAGVFDGLLIYVQTDKGDYKVLDIGQREDENGAATGSLRALQAEIKLETVRALLFNLAFSEE